MAANKTDPRPLTNPRAEWLSAVQIAALVRDFYGTKVLMFDPTVAEAFLGMNSGSARSTAASLSSSPGR